jgi:hypothetical protein
VAADRIRLWSDRRIAVLGGVGLQRNGATEMTRAQQRLNARYARALQSGTQSEIAEAQDAVIGDALYRRNQARMTPIDRAIRDQGLYATARQAYRHGVSFIDLHVAIFRTMPRMPLPTDSLRAKQ